MFRQSNQEGDLIDWVQEARTAGAALVINPAGYGHTSVALLDALKTLTIPIIECHLSNPAAREEFRRTTYVSLAATGRLFYLATSHNLYQPLEWRINKIAAQRPEAKVPEKQESETPKVAAAGMDYLFWKILRDEQPVTNP